MDARVAAHVALQVEVACCGPEHKRGECSTCDSGWAAKRTLAAGTYFASFPTLR